MDNDDTKPADYQDFRFALEDPKWLEYLQANGYVVIKQTMSPEEVARARDLIWTDIEHTNAGVTRDDVGTWNSVAPAQTGLIANLAQSAGTWFVRGIPRIKSAFARIWNEEELLVSMDAAIIWRPWWINSKWTPRTEGLHLDQNPFSKPKLDCIQGMMALYPVTPNVGGLQVVPRSHLDAAKVDFKKNYQHLAGAGDWCPLHSDDPNYDKTILLCCESGDLILWDSRTIHGGHVGTGQDPALTAAPPEDAQAPATPPEDTPCTLARMSVTVAMTPRAWASEETQKFRYQGCKKGLSFNHCPHEAGTSSGTIKALRKKGFAPVVLNQHQLQLLGGPALQQTELLLFQKDDEE